MKKNATDAESVLLHVMKVQSDGRWKGKTVKDDYCDGLGDCLPQCPTGAIRFVEREAAPYDEQAVLENQRKKAAQSTTEFSGCPGQRMRQLHPESGHNTEQKSAAQSSQLAQWPCQIKLVPVHAPYFNGAKLLIAADCTAYAYANVHQEFMRGKVTLIGCPKLDEGDYSEKLTQIIAENEIQSITILRMEVPCCGGLEMAAKKALQNSGKIYSMAGRDSFDWRKDFRLGFYRMKNISKSEVVVFGKCNT